MGSGFLIDTNILIDAQSRKMPEKALGYLAGIINVDFTVSFVSYIEFLGYKQATVAMEEFIGLANIIEINKAVMKATIELRKAHRIQLPDAIIAATAMVNGFTLVTRNISDFRNISGLKIVNPWDKG